MSAASKIEQLVRKGIHIPNPQSVEIGDDVSIDRISGQDVTIYSGSKLYGRDTFISDGVQIGYEGPATVENCCLGPNVVLNGGFFKEAIFLEGAVCGLGSHVRQGTILEEQASIAHTVGLKQTILFPYVTLGSLINFCDCFMGGGTGPKNHSEVGSSYIHFNFTPNQDKATPSMIGDVPRGVMLNQPPIFLGGQGGLVGPRQLAYGTVVAAGTICRKDQSKENHLVMESGPRTARMPLRSGSYRNFKRILAHNLNYIGNLYALRHWYGHVRSQFVGQEFALQIMEGLRATLGKGIDERIHQLIQLRDKISEASGKPGGIERAFCANIQGIQEKLSSLLEFEGHAPSKDGFTEVIRRQIQVHGRNYLKVIQGLDQSQAELGITWLQGIVDHLNAEIAPLIKAD